MMNLTSNQLLAINHDGENILVSAGAGSGKTAVLTERVMAKLSRGVLIDDLIILTFTNAAAAEMKMRIKNKIIENAKYSKQLKRLDNAVISTFDSFALRLVKEYHYLIGLSNNIRIVDSVVSSRIKEKLLDEVLDESYKSGCTTFLSSVDRIFDRGDQTYRDAVITLYNGLEANPNRYDYLDNYENKYYSTIALCNAVKDYQTLLNRRIDEIQVAIKLMNEQLANCDDDKIHDFVILINKLYASLKTNCCLEEIFAFFKDLSHPSIPRLSKENQELFGTTLKDQNDHLKKLVYALRDDINKLFVDDTEQIKNAILETKESTLAVVATCKTFLTKLIAYKQEHNMFEYTDIMNLAIRILKEFPDIRNRYRNRINEIMVDEYQDTNDLQDYLLHLLDKGNVFLVGDVKQSIYGFRNANPNNFIAKYHDFETNGTGKTIDLLENFRSRKETLAGINEFFFDIMDEEIGGVNYKNRQALVYGNHEYDQNSSNKTDYFPEVLVYKNEIDSQIHNNKTILKPYHEGQIIALDIISKIKQGFCVYDSHKKCNRLATYSDFTILVDRKSGFEHYQQALVDQGLPVVAVTDEKFIASTEILFIHNCLCLLKHFACSVNFSEEIKPVLYGVARSFVYQIPDNIVIQVLNDIPLNSRDDLAQLANLPAFMQLYLDFSNLANTAYSLPLDEMLMALYKQIKIFDKLVSLPDPESVESKLMFLLGKAKELPEFTFDDFINYFQDLYDNGNLDVEYSRPYDAQTNAVKIMTMHKSKGLEFSVCYYPGLDKRFNYSESKAFFIFDKQYGLFTKSWDNGFKETIIHQLSKWYNYKDYVSERLRLFYVALTRAKEKIILVYDESKAKSPFLSYNNSGYLDAVIRSKYGSFKDILESVPAVKKWFKPLESIETNITISPTQDPIPFSKPIIYKKIDIQIQKLSESHYSKQLTDFQTPNEKAALEYGEHLHRELELFDFSNKEASLLLLPDLLKRTFMHFLSQSELKGIDDAIIHKEYEFFDENNGHVLHGIIDLLIEYSDRIVIVDYKLKNVVDQMYINQLNGYRQFIQKVSNKPVYTYLYSLAEMQLIAIGGV
ncbi:MAG: UvrD-helicase domain-containing protein [Candidatus Izemoplasmatales bacterium]|nr:UvrD-helicase domain-containing protein [Candidatus Izemoplasmatales bacterium]